MFPVFTDGSAEDQKQWEYTVAGGAIVIVDSYLSFHCSKQLGFPLVGPNHNSYRAEVFAILMCFNHLWLPQIFSDCLSAVQTLQRMIHQAARGCKHYHCEDWDLWGLIWKHVVLRPANRLQITHVESHRDYKQLVPFSYNQWTAYWNEHADRAAKEAVRQAASSGKHARQCSQKVTTETYKYYPQIIQFLCTTAIKYLDGKKEDKKVEQHVIVDFAYLIPTGPYIQHPCDLSEEDILNCPYNSTFARAVVAWLSELQWPIDDCEATGPISLIELYADFCLFSGFSTPVQIIPPCQRTRGTQVQYHLRHEHVLADLAPMNLSDQSRIWTRSLQWVCRRATWYNQLSFFQARSWVAFGYRMGHMSIRYRPKLTNETCAYNLLHRFFHTSVGKRRNMHGNFNIAKRGG